MMRHQRRRLGLLLSAFMVCSAIGCGGPDGPELAAVSGTVRLDGEPLPGADLLFIPENGSTSSGATDKNGYYYLRYSASRDGAMPGKHTVRISTYRPAHLDGEGKHLPGSTEKLPPEYHRDSKLTQEVKSGKNTIDFDLKSGGKIVQPRE